MKKTCLLIVLSICLCCFTIHAEEPSPINQITQILNTNTPMDDADYQMISLFSPELSDSEKMIVFSANKESPWGPFILNFILGAGIGSFVQGNTSAGWIELGLGAAGLILYISGVSDLLDSDPAENSTDGAGKMMIGALSLLTARVYGIISPFTYAKSANDSLTDALYGSTTTLVLLPAIGGEGIALDMSITIPLNI